MPATCVSPSSIAWFPFPSKLGEFQSWARGSGDCTPVPLDTFHRTASLLLILLELSDKRAHCHGAWDHRSLLGRGAVS